MAAASGDAEGRIPAVANANAGDDLWIEDRGWDAEEEDRVRTLLARHSEKCDIQETEIGTAQKLPENEIWNSFYATHGTRFFKDRHYLEREFPNELSPEIMSTFDGDRTLIELGCGVGNAMLPFLESNIEALRRGDDCCTFSTIHGLDLSRTAVELLRKDRRFVEYNEKISALHRPRSCYNGGVFAHICDITARLPPSCIGAADVTSSLFCLSAIDPDMMAAAARNIALTLKLDGVLIFRDYGRYDEAQMKLGTSRGKRVKDNFYQKHDGTKCFYFTTEDVTKLFENAGLEVLEVQYIRRIYMNYGTGAKRRRVWVQGRFRKPLLGRLLSPSSVTEKMIITCILFCGLPGSGKSHAAEFVAEALARSEEQNERHHVEHIEYDRLEEERLQRGDASDNTGSGHEEQQDDDDDDHQPWESRRRAWNEARVAASQRLQDRVDEILKSSNGEGSHTFILDDNYHLRGMRKEVHRFMLTKHCETMSSSNDLSIRFGIVWMDTPFETCVQRNDARHGPRRVPPHVMRKMRQSFEPPSAYWEGRYLRVQDSTRCDDGILQYVKSCPPIVAVKAGTVSEDELRAEREKTMANKKHQVDQLLRKYVGRIARCDKSYAKQANMAKNKLCQKLKGDGGDLDRYCSGSVLDATIMSREFVAAMAVEEGGRKMDESTASTFESILKNE